MKKVLLPTILLIVTLMTAACGDDDTVTDSTPNNQAETEQDTNTDALDETTDNTDTNTDNNPSNKDDMKINYNFNNFSLEADVENEDDAIDVEYEVETDETEASYFDKQQGINLVGNEAMDELDSIFNTFSFDENTADEEVLNEVIEAFNIPEDATNIELEIDYKSGVEKEYRR